MQALKRTDAQQGTATMTTGQKIQRIERSIALHYEILKGLEDIELCDNGATVDFSMGAIRILEAEAKSLRKQYTARCVGLLT